MIVDEAHKLGLISVGKMWEWVIQLCLALVLALNIGIAASKNQFVNTAVSKLKACGHTVFPDVMNICAGGMRSAAFTSRSY